MVDSGGEADPRMPVVHLSRDGWDDYNFQTLFGAMIVFPDAKAIDLGGVKIMRAGQLANRVGTEIPTSFRRLGPEYCSLGQDIEYYEKLAALPGDVRSAYLEALRDAAADESIKDDFENEPAFQTSFLRFGQAVHALEAGSELIRRDQAASGRTRQRGRARFTFERFGVSDLQVPFVFDGSGDLPGRCNIVIGYNGVGKTHFLAQMARVASRGGSDGESPDDERATALSGPDRTFAAVVAISYSAFDKFKLPRSRDAGLPTVPTHGKDTSATTFFGYTYCGLRRTDETRTDQSLELKNLDEIDDEFLEALDSARDRWMDEPDLTIAEEVKNSLNHALAVLEQEPSFGRIGISPSAWAHDPQRARTEIGTLSTGHKIVANIVVQLAAHLRSRSLVLIDEPETHLHPPLLAALLRAIQGLLDAFDSFAVIATHSPVVLQEIPAQYVKVLQRVGDTSRVEAPRIETFGESISEITRHVFSLDSSATDYQGVIRDLAEDYSLDEVEDMFDLGLSSQARALFLRAKKEAR